MAPQAERTVERIAHSILLTAVSRVVLPLAVPVVGWLAVEVIALKEQTATLPDLARRVEVVERLRERGDQAAERQAARLAGIEAQIAALAATQAATVRTLERIERVLDRRNDRP